MTLGAIWCSWVRVDSDRVKSRERVVEWASNTPKHSTHSLRSAWLDDSWGLSFESRVW